MYIIISLFFPLIIISKDLSDLQQKAINASYSERIKIPAGEFTLGMDVPKEDEGNWGKIFYLHPARKIYLDDFYIDKYEVTYERYMFCVQAKICEKPNIKRVYYKELYNKEKHTPITYINWFNARKFCKWIGGDLPTTAQWEKAARGQTRNKFIWGNNKIEDRSFNDAPIFTNFFDKKAEILRTKYQISDIGPAPINILVELYPLDKSPYGVIGMGGNVSEWVRDVYFDYTKNLPYKNPELSNHTFLVKERNLMPHLHDPTLITELQRQGSVNPYNDDWYKPEEKYSIRNIKGGDYEHDDKESSYLSTRNSARAYSVSAGLRCIFNKILADK
jgi:hypothetical protein